MANKGQFKPGQKPPPNAGRPKGSPNKKTKEFQIMLEEKGFDPGAALVELYQKQMGLFEDFRKRHPNRLTMEAGELLAKAGTTLNNICQYVYPKKKAIEHSGEVGVKTFADFMAAAKGGRKP